MYQYRCLTTGLVALGVAVFGIAQILSTPNVDAGKTSVAKAAEKSFRAAIEGVSQKNPTGQNGPTGLPTANSHRRLHGDFCPRW